MRVLLDENLPHDLGSLLPGHEVSTVQGVGWAGVKNGELLRRASGLFDVFLTMDRQLERQQKLGDLPFGVVVIQAKSNRIQDLQPLVADILTALESVKAGKIQHVGA